MQNAYIRFNNSIRKHSVSVPKMYSTW